MRIYGELVDVLWRRGDVDSALRLEALWNELLTRQPVSLLCGYWMETFVAHHAHRDVFTYHTSVQH